MERNKAGEFLKEMLKEQLYCLGRVVARHNVPEDVTWEVVKGFDIIYQKVKEQAEKSDRGRSKPYIYKMEPHPGIMYLLDKIEK